MDTDTLRRFMEQDIPFNRYLGMKIRALDDARVQVELPFREEFIGDPLRGAMHGGVLATLADVAGGLAVWAAIGELSTRVATIDIRIDYLRPGKRELVVAEARVVRQGNRVGVSDMRLFHPSAEDQAIATGKGVYNIVKARD